MTEHSLPEPIAEGDLSRTPFAHLLLYVQRHELTGTLVLWQPAADSERAGQDRIRFELGEPVAARLVDRASRIELGMLRIFSRTAGPYAFYGDVDLVGDGPEVRTGHVDPHPLLAASLRGSARDDAVDAVLERFGSSRVRLTSDVDLDRFQLLPEERAFVDMLRAQPESIVRLAAMSALPPRMAERLLYLLAITKSIEPWDEPAEPSARPPAARVSAPSVPRPDPSPSPPPAAPSEPRAAASRSTAAPPPTPDSLSDEQRAHWDEIVQRSVTIETENYFQMLGLARDAPSSGVQKAYFGLVKRWHPDRLPPELGELRPVVETIFRHLTRAQEVLSDDTKRGPYIASVQDGGGTPEADRKLGMIVQAALDFRKVEIMIKQRQLDQALELVERLLQVTQDDADYQAAHGWLLFQRNQADAKERVRALAAIDRALAIAPKHDKAHFYRGSILKKMGRDEEAIEHLRQAAALNPRNIDAVREVRLAEMRKGSGAPASGESQSSLLSKLFGPNKKK